MEVVDSKKHGRLDDCLRQDVLHAFWAVHTPLDSLNHMDTYNSERKRALQSWDRTERDQWAQVRLGLLAQKKKAQSSH